MAAAAFMVAAASAGEPSTFEVSGGGEIGAYTWSAYSNTTIALSGLIVGVPKSIQEDGWRLRAGAGYWRFARKDKVGYPSTTDPRRTVSMSGSFAELLLGYHKNFGPLTIKAYAGVGYADASGEYGDFAWRPDFDALSPKVIVESWYNLTPDVFAQLDVSWSGSREEYGGRARLGYRLMPSLSVGPEFAYWSARSDPIYPTWYGTRDNLTRYGGFVRYEWASGEASLSAGMVDDGEQSDFYATLNALLRF